MCAVPVSLVGLARNKLCAYYIDESERRLFPTSPGRIAFGLAAELILFWRIDIEDTDDLTPNLNRIAIYHRGRAGDGFCTGCGTGQRECDGDQKYAHRASKASDNSCTAMGAKLTSFPRDVGSQLSLQGS